MAEAKNENRIENGNERKYGSINDKYFVNKSISNLFKCIECGYVPYPCFTILNKNKFVCQICKSLSKYNSVTTNKEIGLNTVIGTANIYCLNNTIDKNYEGTVVETKQDNNGCLWKGKISEWNEHNNECGLSWIVCKYCHSIKGKILRKNIDKHYNVCNEYPIKCTNNSCNKIIKRKDMNIHCQNECKYQLISCKYKGCDNIIIKHEYSKHLNECPKRIVSCEYKEFGCNMSMTHDELKEHNEDFALKHCKYLTKEMQTVKSELSFLKNIIKECNMLLVLKNDNNLVLKSAKVHEYDNLILNDKSVLTVNGYNNDDKKGGLLILKIWNTLVINDNSKINLNGLGYKGGYGDHQGHSYKGNSVISNKNNYGGGGSGPRGAGAGYGTKGQTFGFALGGECYGNNKLDILYLGSGGGGSELFKGGNGGGSIKIECNKLIIHKHSGIYCNGSNGNGLSGGGSGGSIYIICNELINYGNIHAKGGKSKYNGSGGFGRIRIDCNKITKKGSIIPEIGYNKYSNKSWW